MDNKIRLSIGSAAVLNLKKIKTNAKSTTIYLMNSGGCQFNCSFCAQARNATAKRDKLSRITWPEYDSQKVLTALTQKNKNYKRICMQVVNSRDVFTSLPETVKKLRKSSPKAKIAITIRTYAMPVIDAMFQAGADEVGLSIDAVDPKQFGKIKGGDFEFYKNFIIKAAKKYPGKIATHLIAGLGETEKQMVELIKQLHQATVIIALFAFTPVKGADMEFNAPPEISSYRRIQVALHLIRNDLDKNFKYNKKGQITNFGYKKDELHELLINSNAFETSGCTDCNRPYYNDRAGSKNLFNYPKKVAPTEFKQIFESIFGTKT